MRFYRLGRDFTVGLTIPTMEVWVGLGCSGLRFLAKGEMLFALAIMVSLGLVGQCSMGDGISESSSSLSMVAVFLTEWGLTWVTTCWVNVKVRWVKDRIGGGRLRSGWVVAIVLAGDCMRAVGDVGWLIWDEVSGGLWSSCVMTGGDGLGGLGWIMGAVSLFMLLFRWSKAALPKSTPVSSVSFPCEVRPKTG